MTTTNSVTDIIVSTQWRPRLRRAGYGRYEIVTGPSAGAIVRRNNNPTTYATLRWLVVTGPLAHRAHGSSLASCLWHAYQLSGSDQTVHLARLAEVAT